MKRLAVIACMLFGVSAMSAEELVFHLGSGSLSYSGSGTWSVSGLTVTSVESKFNATPSSGSCLGSCSLSFNITNGTYSTPPDKWTFLAGSGSDYTVVDTNLANPHGGTVSGTYTGTLGAATLSRASGLFYFYLFTPKAIADATSAFSTLLSDFYLNPGHPYVGALQLTFQAHGFPLTPDTGASFSNANLVTGELDLTATPEKGTFVLLGAALVLIGLLKLRRLRA